MNAPIALASRPAKRRRSPAKAPQQHPGHRRFRRNRTHNRHSTLSSRSMPSRRSMRPHRSMRPPNSMRRRSSMPHPNRHSHPIHPRRDSRYRNQPAGFPFHRG